MQPYPFALLTHLWSPMLILRLSAFTTVVEGSELAAHNTLLGVQRKMGQERNGNSSCTSCTFCLHGQWRSWILINPLAAGRISLDRQEFPFLHCAHRHLELGHATGTS